MINNIHSVFVSSEPGQGLGQTERRWGARCSPEARCRGTDNCNHTRHLSSTLERTDAPTSTSEGFPALFLDKPSMVLKPSDAGCEGGGERSPRNPYQPLPPLPQLHVSKFVDQQGVPPLFASMAPAELEPSSQGEVLGQHRKLIMG